MLNSKQLNESITASLEDSRFSQNYNSFLSVIYLIMHRLVTLCYWFAQTTQKLKTANYSFAEILMKETWERNIFFHLKGSVIYTFFTFT